MQEPSSPAPQKPFGDYRHDQRVRRSAYVPQCVVCLGLDLPGQPWVVHEKGPDGKVYRHRDCDPAKAYQHEKSLAPAPPTP